MPLPACPGIYPRTTSNKKSRLWNCPSMPSSTNNVALGPSCLVRCTIPLLPLLSCSRPVLNIHPLLSLCPTYAPRPSRSRAILTIDPPILSLVPHLILTIDGGNKSIRFVSDQGDDHRVEVEEEHYEVEP